jgi:hypothetical protein
MAPLDNGQSPSRHSGYGLSEVGRPASQEKNVRPNISMIVIAVVGAAACAGGGGLDSWQLRSPLPSPANLYGVAHGGGRFVAVGDAGTIITSTDGTNWWLVPSPTNRALRGVTFGNNRFVAVGDAGTALVSRNGTNWSYHAISPLLQMLAVSSDGARFIAVGEFGVCRQSTDGTNWSSLSSGASGTSYGITYGNGSFTIVGLNGHIQVGNTGGFSAATSTTTNTIRSVSYGGGQFVAVCSFDTFQNTFTLYSANGVNWYRGSAVPGPYGISDLRGVAFGSGTWVAVGNPGPVLSRQPGVVYVSNNGRDWSLRWPSPSGYYLNAVAYGDGQFIAVGDGGAIFSSFDGTNWHKRLSGESAAWRDLLYVNGRAMAFGGGWGSPDAGPAGESYPWCAVQSSRDGRNWISTRLSGNPNSDVVFPVLWNAAYGNGLYCAVGGLTGGAVYSTNGVDWNKTASYFAPYMTTGIAFGQGKFVCVGYGFFVSTNGRDWTWAYTNAWFDQACVAFGGDRYVAFCSRWNNATNFVSYDGIEWVRGTNFNSRAVYAVAQGNGLFVAVGTAGRIMTSTNGFDWEDQISGIADTIQDVTFGHGLFAATTPYTVLISADGRAWLRRPLPPNYYMYTVSAGPDATFLTAGYLGAILQSGSMAKPVLPGAAFSFGTGFSLSFSNAPGAAFFVQASSNLIDWETVVSGVSTQALNSHLDPVPSNRVHRFYRVLGP